MSKLFRVSLQIINVVAETLNADGVHAFLNPTHQAGTFVSAEVEAPGALEMFEELFECRIDLIFMSHGSSAPQLAAANLFALVRQAALHEFCIVSAARAD